MPKTGTKNRDHNSPIAGSIYRGQAATDTVSIVREVMIKQEPVELFKLLKFGGMANSGGEAKRMIEDGWVYVNGELETRKRRKIMAGDVIAIGEEEITAVLVASAE